MTTQHPNLPWNFISVATPTEPHGEKTIVQILGGEKLLEEVPVRNC